MVLLPWAMAIAAVSESVVPDPLYRKKEVQQSAEVLAAAFSGEILADL